LTSFIGKFHTKMCKQFSAGFETIICFAQSNVLTLLKRFNKTLP
jgi:hypothetical protein